MITKKHYAYARPTMVERICPVCNYSYKSFNGDTHFIRLETVQCYNHPNGDNGARLYACPKCGTVGIDVEAKD